MKRKETYREFIERVTASVDYKVEVASLEFVEELVRAMTEAGVNQAELARRVGASEAYVSKVLRGDTNFTLATMVKLATAVGADTRVHLAPAGSTVYWRDVITAPVPDVAWPQVARPRPLPNIPMRPGGLDADALAAA